MVCACIEGKRLHLNRKALIIEVRLIFSFRPCVAIERPKRQQQNRSENKKTCRGTTTTTYLSPVGSHVPADLVSLEHVKAWEGGVDKTVHAVHQVGLFEVLQREGEEARKKQAQSLVNNCRGGKTRASVENGGRYRLYRGNRTRWLLVCYVHFFFIR